MSFLPFFAVNTDGLIPLLVVALYGICWLFALGGTLTRDDFDPVTRLTWVVVIIFVPVFGILYLVLTPRGYLVDREHSVSESWSDEPESRSSGN
jgi:hypothetical protein